jgi:hypothetical protein
MTSKLEQRILEAETGRTEIIRLMEVIHDAFEDLENRNYRFNGIGPLRDSVEAHWVDIVIERLKAAYIEVLKHGL